MEKEKFARYVFKKRGNVLRCQGQVRNRTGQYWPSLWVDVPLPGSSAADLKIAMADGIEKLSAK